MKNVGVLDKRIRIVLGILVLSLFFFLDGGWRWISLLGVVFILTGIINFCPLYLPFKINTRKKSS
ncbi:MAG: DUF2892 domain-containing protein [Vallitaleaceae bacterium]|jgi:hypothetical protein|nr:DUF2892 domain-containing protein [Vallitaleaceae bacterium]